MLKNIKQTQLFRKLRKLVNVTIPMKIFFSHYRCILQDYFQMNDLLPAIRKHEEDGPFQIWMYSGEYSDDRPALCGIQERGAGDEDLFFINTFDLPFGLILMVCESHESSSVAKSSPWINQQCQNVYLFIYEFLLTSAPLSHLLENLTSLVVGTDNKVIYFHENLFDPYCPVIIGCPLVDRYPHSSLSLLVWNLKEKN